MARALRLGLVWAYDALDLDVVHWRANVGNWPSRRVAWTCGFRFEGTVRGLLPQRGERYDGWLASLLRGEPMTAQTRWLEAPVIVGAQVVLRPWQDEDVPRLVEQSRDPAAQRWLPDLPTAYGVEQAVASLLERRTGMAEGRLVSWCVADPADDRSVGSVDLFGLARHGNEAELGYLMHPAERGRGRMTEAVRLAVRHAVVPVADGGLGLARVGLRAAADNAPSRAVAERAGFREVGIQREIDPQPDGSVDDLVCYDLLAREVVTR
jgi:RimJ/RimL family protein N-acetyltransferase